MISGPYDLTKIPSSQNRLGGLARNRELSNLLVRLLRISLILVVNTSMEMFDKNLELRTLACWVRVSVAVGQLPHLSFPGSRVLQPGDRMDHHWMAEWNPIG